MQLSVLLAKTDQAGLGRCLIPFAGRVLYAAFPLVTAPIGSFNYFTWIAEKKNVYNFQRVT